MEAVDDIREYDVPYHTRWAIDADMRAGFWYGATAHEGVVTLTHRADLLARGEPRICAFDIETTKLPLHFPNAEHDQVRFKTSQLALQSESTATEEFSAAVTFIVNVHRQCYSVEHLISVLAPSQTDSQPHRVIAASDR